MGKETFFFRRRGVDFFNWPAALSYSPPKGLTKKRRGKKGGPRKKGLSSLTNLETTRKKYRNVPITPLKMWGGSSG